MTFSKKIINSGIKTQLLSTLVSIFPLRLVRSELLTTTLLVIGKTKTSLSRLRRRMEERADNKENNNPDVDPSTVPIPPTPVLEV
jgi:hypothetical protein